MINILVVDDSSGKAQEISRVLNQICSDDILIETAQDINGAKRKLREKNVDIMILDIHLPRTFGSEVIQDGGIRLLREIREVRNCVYSYPKYVISLSEFRESTDAFSTSEGIIHTAINYIPSEERWEKELLDRVSVAIAILSNTSCRRAYDYDVAIICAMKEEVDFVLQLFDDVHRYSVEYDDDIYYVGSFIKQDIRHRVVITYSNQKGMVAMTSLTTKLISHFTPRYLVMTGITGGTKPDRMNFGDVIVASKSWDYRAGKDILSDGERVHLNNIDQQAICSSIIGHCRRISEDVASLRRIKDQFTQGDKPNTELQLLIGPVVSGASVVTDPSIVSEVLNNQDRDVLGIEMEIYGMYYAANWSYDPKPQYVALKAVSDFANSDKGDKYHKYASYTSSKVMDLLIKDYFEYPY